MAVVVVRWFEVVGVGETHLLFQIVRSGGKTSWRAGLDGEEEA